MKGKWYIQDERLYYLTRTGTWVPLSTYAVILPAESAIWRLRVLHYEGFRCFAVRVDSGERFVNVQKEYAA